MHSFDESGLVPVWQIQCNIFLSFSFASITAKKFYNIGPWRQDVMSAQASASRPISQGGSSTGAKESPASLKFLSSSDSSVASWAYSMLDSLPCNKKTDDVLFGMIELRRSLVLMRLQGANGIEWTLTPSTLWALWSFCLRIWANFGCYHLISIFISPSPPYRPLLEPRPKMTFTIFPAEYLRQRKSVI